MQRYKSFYSLVILLAFSAANADVVESGKWSSSSTWSEGEVPSSSLESPYTSLTMGSSGITLEVDSDQWVDRLNVGDYTDTTIVIDSGVTFSIGGCASPKDLITSSSASNTIHFTGDGTLAFGFSKLSDPLINKSTIVFDVNVEGKSHWSNYFNTDAASNITINKNFEVFGQANFAGSTVSVNGSTFSTDTIIAFGKFSLSENTTATVRAINGGNWYIQGNVTVKGAYSWESTRMAIKLNGTNVIGASASLKSTTEDSIGCVLLSGSLTSYAAANAVSFSQKTYLISTSSDNPYVLTLNSSNAINTEGAASQGASNFNIINYYLTYKDNVQTEHFEASHAKIVLGADNDFGSFTYFDGSSLAMETNGFSSTIGSFIGYADGATFTLNLSNHNDFTLKLMELDNIVTFVDDDGFLRAENILVIEDSIGDFAYIRDAGDGGYWINATSAVPEPAAFAACFGALALAFAVLRRRR